MLPPFIDPMPACCPHCRRRDALEWPAMDDVRSLFCRSCQGFKVREADAETLGAFIGAGLMGRMVSHATGDRWLMVG